MLFQSRSAEGVEKDLERRVRADLMQRLALVLENLLPRQRLGLQDATLGWAMHMLDEIARQGTGQQALLLLDEGTSSSVGQVFDGLATQYGELASP